MVSADLARTVVGIIGNVVALFLFLSPVSTFVRIWKKGTVEQYSPIPYLATLVNCLMWTLYGLPMVHPGSILVITINGTGTVIELVYVILFLVFSDPKKRIKVLVVVVVEVVFMAVLTVVVLLVAHNHSQRSMVVGTICILFNIVMYASPLSVMKMVITTKSVEYMPLSLSIAALANGLAWTTYACIRFDPYIMIPNGLGSLFGVAQLILYGSYYKSTKRQMADQGKGRVILSEVITNGKEPWKEADNGRAEVHGV